jgi:hypothetical protein
MKRKPAIFLLSLIMLLCCIQPNTVSNVRGQRSAELKATRVVWGDTPDSPTKAYPGDTERALTVEMQNYSPEETIKGVSAVLFFPNRSFTDVYGNPNASATGSPAVGELLSPTDEIEPKGFFTLTFTLDIDEDTVPDTYHCNMTVKYAIKRNGDYGEGLPQDFVIQIVVSKISSTITVAASPQTAEIGQAVRISGSIDPATENATVNLAYKRPDGTRVTASSKTSADGSFSTSYRPDVDGVWSVNASWEGDAKYEGEWVSASFEIRLPVSLTVTASGNRLTGGVDEEINITILNSGSVPVSALDASFTVASPLVFRGRDHWTFDYLAPGSSTTISVQIYGPSSAIGSTYSGSLVLNYRDDYGEILSETFPVGLIVVGYVELVAYDETVSPQPVRNGSRFEITTTLLNKGNIAAMYVNASILPSEILTLTSESAAYVGEVEENSQSPFTLAAYVKNAAATGTYPVKIGIAYRDDQYVDHFLEFTVNLSVEAQQQTQDGASEGGTTLSPFAEAGLVLLVAAAASVAILLLYRRHMAKKKSLKSPRLAA